MHHKQEQADDYRCSELVECHSAMHSWLKTRLLDLSEVPSCFRYVNMMCIKLTILG